MVKKLTTKLLVKMEMTSKSTLFSITNRKRLNWKNKNDPVEIQTPAGTNLN